MTEQIQSSADEEAPTAEQIQTPEEQPEQPQKKLSIRALEKQEVWADINKDLLTGEQLAVKDVSERIQKLNQKRQRQFEKIATRFNNKKAKLQEEVNANNLKPADIIVSGGVVTMQPVIKATWVFDIPEISRYAATHYLAINLNLFKLTVIAGRTLTKASANSLRQMTESRLRALEVFADQKTAAAEAMFRKFSKTMPGREKRAQYAEGMYALEQGSGNVELVYDLQGSLAVRWFEAVRKLDYYLFCLRCLMLSQLVSEDMFRTEIRAAVNGAKKFNGWLSRQVAVYHSVLRDKRAQEQADKPQPAQQAQSAAKTQPASSAVQTESRTETKTDAPEQSGRSSILSALRGLFGRSK